MEYQLILQKLKKPSDCGYRPDSSREAQYVVGKSDWKTLVGLVGSTWREVLVKMEKRTKSELVETVGEYGVIMWTSDNNVTIIAKFVEVVEGD